MKAVKPFEVQGHRGAGAEAPHNSIEAFTFAGSHPGINSVEFDVLRCADGYLVVTHGPELCPDVAKSSWDELRSNGVPLLCDVVDCCLEAKLIMNVEIKPAKNAGDRVVEDTLEMLREKDALSLCRISSFDRGMLEKVMELEPTMPLGALYQSCEACVDPDDITKGVTFREEPPDFASWFADHKVQGDSVNLRAEAVLRKPSLIEEAKKNGKEVLVWFPCISNKGYEETETSYKKLMDLGVDALCVNFPSLLADMVQKVDEDASTEAASVASSAPLVAATGPEANATAKPVVTLATAAAFAAKAFNAQQSAAEDKAYSMWWRDCCGSS